MARFIYISIILLLSANAYTQVYNAYLEAGDKAFAQSDFYQAMSHYQSALEYEEDQELLYKYAESAFSFSAYQKAKVAYEKLLEQDEPLHQEELLYKLALVNKVRGDYDSAIYLFEKHQSLPDAIKKKYLTQSQKHLKDCLWAKETLNTSTQKTEVTRLDDKINTSHSEFSPFLHNDALYYSSASIEDESSIDVNRKIFIQSKEDQGLPLDGPFNNEYDNVGHLSFNEEGSVAIFTACFNGGVQLENCQIYLTNLSEESEWSLPTILPEHINLTGTNNTQASFGKSPDGKEVIYFVSDRKGGKGGLDIWSSHIVNNEFSAPKNVSSINTAGDELSPFYHEKSASLYFSSDGYHTLGGLDVHSSKMSNDGFGIAKNLGSPVNTSYNDLFYFLNEKGDEAYFSSNRLESTYIDDLNEACCYDLYKAEGMVTSMEYLFSTYERGTEDALNGVKLYLKNTKKGETEEYLDPDDNEYKLSLLTGEDYEVLARKKGFEEESYTFTASEKLKETKLYLEKLVPEEIDLHAKIFDENRKPLFSTKTCISDLKNGTEDCFDNLDKNEFSRKLKTNTDYEISVERIGYKTQSFKISSAELVKLKELSKTIKLFKETPKVISKLSLDGYLPLPLYFDNDKPNSNSLSQTTSKTYEDTHRAYYSRKQTYKAENRSGLNGEQSIISDNKVEDFFELNVKGGYDSLDGFTNQLLKYLNQNNTAIIVLKGYASPRANSDYNKYLTMRRVNSVRNHFQKWNQGALLLYLNNGSLKIIEESLGEAGSSNTVSDDILDKKNSIYSIDASLERRVEIIEIKGN